MSERDGPHGPGPAGRPALLAGILIGTAGLIDVLAATGTLTAEPYVVMADDGMHHLHTSGWGAFHLMLGGLTTLTGALVVLDRAWTAPLAVVVLALSVAVDLLFLPFDPSRSLLGIGFEVAAVVVLARHGRLRAHRSR